ncbi:MULTISPECIES: sensor histidine kinase [Bacillaceae]|uniref:Sensor histidine kinase n=1 Tax=Evansella alkalicola TaxID=745819 RepID=A0ABS6JR12_9BACI|nr:MULTISPECIES: sensor histidine kinase [Bacillaceae]MBU9720994.1 sensor histidine kinase [Bacillus alkalicola]
MQSPIRFFNNLKLRSKLLILYLLCVFIPIVVTNVTFYSVTTNNIKNQKMDDVDLVLEQITNEFLNVVDQAMGISAGFYSNTRLYEFLDTDYENSIQYIEAFEDFISHYNVYSPLYYSIQDISYYTNNPTVIYAGGIRTLEEAFEEGWYDGSAPGSHPVFVKPDPQEEGDLFSVIRSLDYFRAYSANEKFIRIDINPLSLRQIFNNVTFPGNVYLLNNEGEIEFSNDYSINWRSETVSFNSISLNEDTILLDEKVLPQSYIEGWRMVGVISESDILEELHQSVQFILFFALLNFTIPTIIIILISRSLHVRLARILKYMKKMKEQDFETIDSQEAKDEIGELTIEFNKMTRTIRTLINEVYVANIDKKDLELKEKQAQLSALQSQINPHFLFNALETIRMRSLIKGEKETAKIIQNMAKIFRNSLTWGKEWVTVKEELTLILCFLEIQKYRFGDKLEYSIDIDENVYDSLIPNMAFLPFVENASIHGIESVKDTGLIQIKIKKVNDEVVFTVQDDGSGFEKDKLDKMLDSLKNEESMGESIGIKNVYYRLKLYYKTDFGFSIKSTPGKGTTVEIRLKSEREYIN